MKYIKQTITALFIIAGALTATPLLVTESVYAQSAADQIGQGVEKVGGDQNTVKLEDQIKNITNVLLFILGAIAVVMIIIGGIRYATSNGDSSQTKAAKDTIMYAVIGLVVAVVAYAIVRFVLEALKQ